MAAAASSPAVTRSPLVPFIEICVDSVASAKAAKHGGAHRVELCSGLVEGGLTPSYGLIKAVREVGIDLMVLIRPRAGDFLYSSDELSVMRSDVEMCKQLGVDGVVVGFLTPEGDVDETLTKEFLQLAQPMSITFHRAIDMTRDILESARRLREIGIRSILTSGGQPDCIQGQETIKSLVKFGLSDSDRSMSILAGGGLTEKNIPDFVCDTSVQCIHASLRGNPIFGGMMYLVDGIYMGGEKRNDGAYVEYATKQADEEKIRAVVGLTERIKSPPSTQ